MGDARRNGRTAQSDGAPEGVVPVLVRVHDPESRLVDDALRHRHVISLRVRSAFGSGAGPRAGPKEVAGRAVRTSMDVGVAGDATAEPSCTLRLRVSLTGICEREGRRERDGAGDEANVRRRRRVSVRRHPSLRCARRNHAPCANSRRQRSSSTGGRSFGIVGTSRLAPSRALRREARQGGCRRAAAWSSFPSHNTQAMRRQTVRFGAVGAGERPAFGNFRPAPSNVPPGAGVPAMRWQ